MPPIGLFEFGRLLNTANAVPGQTIIYRGDLSAIRSLLGEHPKIAQEFLGPLFNAKAFLGLRNALLDDAPLQQNLPPLFGVCPVFIRQAMIDDVIRHCKEIGRCYETTFLFSRKHKKMDWKKDFIPRLLDASRQLQYLQLFAGVAWLFEQKNQLKPAMQLYKWYLICQEQIDQDTSVVDPSYMAWGRDRLITVCDKLGETELADQLRNFCR